MTRKNLFSLVKSTSIKPSSGLARCGSCGLKKGCISPKMPPTGEGRKKILVIAECPGEEEDRKGIHLIGQSGILLRKQLKKIGVDLDKDCWKTNAVLCHSPNDAPTNDQIDACKPHLIRTINKYKPNLIIPLGLTATKSLIEWVQRGKKIEAVGKWVGYVIPAREPNTWIAPMYHPAYILRMKDDLLNKLFRRQLKAAIKKADTKPWIIPPNYKQQVHIVGTDKAVKLLKKFQNSKAISFDYEATALKPEMNGAEIVSCSVSNDKTTIAYLWTKKTAEATKQLLRSPVPKIAANIKFEERWTREHLKTSVKNWYWDTMLAAHVIDNNPGISSLNFQSFVFLGMETYDTHIHPYLKSSGQGRLNRIRELPIEDLLLYNGLDSLLEYKLAFKQIEILHGKKRILCRN